MPQHKSAIKRDRQSKKRRLENRAKRSRMRTLVKKVLTTTEKTEAEVFLRDATSYVDRMAKVGIVHKNKAANTKSQLTKYVNTL